MVHGSVVALASAISCISYLVSHIKYEFKRLSSITYQVIGESNKEARSNLMEESEIFLSNLSN